MSARRPSRLTVPPATEPVSLFDAKMHLRVDDTAEDALIERAITTARRWAEHHTGRAFVTQGHEAYWDAWPAAFLVPLPPLVAVTAITWRDGANTSRTVPPSDYLVDALAGRITPAPGRSWPTGGLWPVNPIAVAFSAGYGAAADVPAEIRSALLLIVGHLYEHREQVTEAKLVSLPFAVSALLADYVAKWW